MDLEELNPKNEYGSLKIDCPNPECETRFFLGVARACPVCRTEFEVEIRADQ